MKKIFFLICLFVILVPSLVLAFDEKNLTADPVFVSFADLQAKGKLDISVHFKLTAPASELKPIKLIKLSVEDTCAGKTGFHLQAGDFRPAANDSDDGVIEGNLVYQADKVNSCKGKHDLTFYFCSAIDSRCFWATAPVDRINVLTIKDVVEIGDNSPSPTSSVEPTASGGGQPENEYLPLLPFKGKFSSVWDVLVMIVNLLLALAGVVAVGALIAGGYQYMTSSGIPDKAAIAKSTLTYAIIGLILVIAFYAILRFLLPALGVSNTVIWF